MTTNINFYGKPFGAPLLPNKMTSDGWSIADARHIGGHRVVDTVDDLYELYDWQLVNPSALLHNDKSSAAGQKWYVKGDGTYMLKSYDNRTSSAGWVKVEDNAGHPIVPDLTQIKSDIEKHNKRISDTESKLVTNANKPNGAIVLDANGRIPSTAKTAFKKINGNSILKTEADTSDITIDLSLFVIPANNTLPTNPADINPNKIYLIQQAPPAGTFPGSNNGNIYIEYLYVNNAWEKIGEYKADVNLSGYLKKADAETAYVKRSSGSPATYILDSSSDLNAYDSSVTNTAASVYLLYNVKQDLQDSINGRSETNHTHTVTINSTTKTIGGGKTIDLGTYATPDSVRTTISTFTYDKTTIDTALDNKIGEITASSLGIYTLTSAEIDTMFTQIFG